MSDLTTLQAESLQQIAASTSLDGVESLRVALLGKKGVVSLQMQTLATLEGDAKRQFGKDVNQVKQAIDTAIVAKKQCLEQAALQAKLVNEAVDVSLPARPAKQGSVHPVSQVIDEVTVILGDMGFTVADGPEIEDDFHNFTALNIPAHHPAREMQDTFYIEDKEGKTVLRTHTSSVQIRYMEEHEPPYKIMAPGRVYRSDYDMTHTPMFHQVEGLMIDKAIHMGHLKGCIASFLERFFGVEEVPLRFRPSFFPFTEPSAEVDIGYGVKDGQIVIGGGDKWLEILGCGMVHQNVLTNVGVDVEQYQGFAFGLGIERLTMLKYGIPDLRYFFDQDKRKLDQYGFSPFLVPHLLGRV